MQQLGGMVAAGVAGATVAGVATAASAGAAAGGVMILGGANDAGTIDTRLTARTSKRVLSVTNTSSGAAVGAIGRPVAAGGSVATAGNGPALEVQGVATFTRSGVVEVTIDNSTVVEVPVPGGLKESSHVLAMAQNVGLNGGTVVYPIIAEPNVATGKVKIHLNANVGDGVTLKIAWFVCG